MILFVLFVVVIACILSLLLTIRSDYPEKRVVDTREDEDFVYGIRALARTARVVERLPDPLVQLFRALAHYGAEHFVLVRKAAVKHPRSNARTLRDRAHGSVRKALFHELRFGALQKFCVDAFVLYFHALSRFI